MTEETKKLIDKLPIQFKSVNSDWVSKSDVISIIEEFTKWNKVKESTPLAWETGDWDGKKSDLVLAKDSCGVPHIAKVYEGIIDGIEFCDFYDEQDFEIDGITEWKYIN